MIHGYHGTKLVQLIFICGHYYRRIDNSSGFWLCCTNTEKMIFKNNYDEHYYANVVHYYDVEDAHNNHKNHNQHNLHKNQINFAI